jgi:hypothetical protein
MKFTQQAKLNKDFKPKEEEIVRELVSALVNKIQFEELLKLIDYTKVDPESKESQDKLRNPFTPDWKKGQIYDLGVQNQIFYTIKLTIN